MCVGSHLYCSKIIYFFFSTAEPEDSDSEWFHDLWANIMKNGIHVCAHTDIFLNLPQVG